MSRNGWMRMPEPRVCTLTSFFLQQWHLPADLCGAESITCRFCLQTAQGTKWALEASYYCFSTGKWAVLKPKCFRNEGFMCYGHSEVSIQPCVVPQDGRTSASHKRWWTGRSADLQHQFTPAVDGAEFPGACGPQKPGYLNHFQEMSHFHGI